MAIKYTNTPKKIEAIKEKPKFIELDISSKLFFAIVPIIRDAIKTFISEIISFRF